MKPAMYALAILGGAVLVILALALASATTPTAPVAPTAQQQAQRDFDNCVQQLETLAGYRIGGQSSIMPAWARDEYAKLYRRCESLRRKAAGEPVGLFGALP